MIPFLFILSVYHESYDISWNIKQKLSYVRSSDHKLGGN